MDESKRALFKIKSSKCNAPYIIRSNRIFLILCQAEFFLPVICFPLRVKWAAITESHV